MLTSEQIYTKVTDAAHIKRYGQYFTKDLIADFMCRWTSANAKTMLDPAVGNSVFFKYTRKYNQRCQMTGYEIDSHMLRFFGNPTSAEIFASSEKYFSDVRHRKTCLSYSIRISQLKIRNTDQEVVNLPESAAHHYQF